jgi:hypothetical protein
MRPISACSAAIQLSCDSWGTFAATPQKGHAPAWDGTFKDPFICSVACRTRRVRITRSKNGSTRGVSVAAVIKRWCRTETGGAPPGSARRLRVTGSIAERSNAAGGDALPWIRHGLGQSLQHGPNAS